MTEDTADDLAWHALNYRTAATQHAEAMWQELAACVERKIAAERERCANVCQQVAEENANQDSYHWNGCMDCKAAIEGHNAQNA